MGLLDSWGDLALHSAAGEGDYDRVGELIDDGEDLEERDGTGRTPFLRAAFHGQTEILELLYEEGANIAAVDNWMRSALHLAAKEDHGDAVEYLLDLGLNACAQDNYGRQPLHLAALNDCVDTLNILLNETHVFVNARDKCLRTPLHIAVTKNNFNAAYSLIEANANLLARDEYKYQPHHVAAAYGATECLRILLEYEKVRLNARNDENKTPLHLAYEFGHEDCQNLLLDSGADPDVVDSNGNTPEDLE